MSSLKHVDQFFCKGPGNEYFKLCKLKYFASCHKYSNQFCHCSAKVDMVNI